MRDECGSEVRGQDTAIAAWGRNASAVGDGREDEADVSSADLRWSCCRACVSVAMTRSHASSKALE
jgi:hypothetical protein